MKLPELEDSVRSGRLVPDGKICLNASGELAVTKFAVEPVWYLPGVAERFGIDQGTLRRSLFEYTGGMYPEVSIIISNLLIKDATVDTRRGGTRIRCPLV